MMPGSPVSSGPSILPCVPWGRSMRCLLPSDFYTHKVLGYHTCNGGQAPAPKQLSPRRVPSARGLTGTPWTVEFSQTGDDFNMVVGLWI